MQTRTAPSSRPHRPHLQRTRARRRPPLQPISNFEGLRTIVRILLRELIGSENAQTKERDFTLVMAKTLKLKQDAVECSSGSTGRLIKSVESFVEVVSAAKRLMRPSREFLRTRKPGFLQQLGPILPPILQSMRESADLHPGLVFGAACIKAEFLNTTPQGSAAPPWRLRLPHRRRAAARERVDEVADRRRLPGRLHLRRAQGPGSIGIERRSMVRHQGHLRRGD